MVVWSIKGYARADVLAAHSDGCDAPAVLIHFCDGGPAKRPSSYRSARERFVAGIGTSEALNEDVTTARQARIDVLLA